MDKPKRPDKVTTAPKPEALPMSALDKAMRGLVGVPKQELREQELKEKQTSKRGQRRRR